MVTKFPMSAHEPWPELPLAQWKETYATLHRWTQVIGKIRTRLSPPVNHWWHSALQVSARGLHTGLIPHGDRAFDLELDFVDHRLVARTSDGQVRQMPLFAMSVADFHRRALGMLDELGLKVIIDPQPQEIRPPEEAIRLDRDEKHRSYDPVFAERHWRILLRADRLMKEFRGQFIGKCSPVHFFWGSFDLAVTRFSGRRAPERAGVDGITREAYSHEVISCGFWPGSGDVEGPAFYAYAAPEPEGFADLPRTPHAARVPEEAFYNPSTRGYVLMLDDVRRSPEPDQLVMDFFQSTYELAADLGGWDRASLEREPPTRVRAEKAA